MSLPLEGVRVLDLFNVLAGPFCGYNLARLGAEVIKIENPKGGDLARHLGADPTMAQRLFGLSFVAVNACKQSIAIDLKSPEGRGAFLRLVDQADVLLENFRPKVMERLGLGYAVLAKRNPRLIYCAIRLRSGRPLGKVRLRPDRARCLGRDERNRRSPISAVAHRLSDLRHHGRYHSSLRNLGGAGRAAFDGPRSVHRYVAPGIDSGGNGLGSL